MGENREKQMKWRRQIWLVSVTLTLKNQITVEKKSELEITIITSVNVILMEHWKAILFKEQWGGDKIKPLTLFYMDKLLNTAKTAHAASQVQTPEPMKEAARLTSNA